MPQSLDQVSIIILFIIPGFVFSRIFGFALPSRVRGTTQLILDSIAASCINYASLSPLVWWLLYPDAPNPLWAVLSGWFFILFLFPVISALIFIRIVDSPKARKIREFFHFKHPDPKAWDFFFRQGRTCWVIATLKDERVIAGLFSTDSFASAYPNEEDLYLEELCKLSSEGKITGLVENSQGAIIRMEDVELLEFYSVGDSNRD